MQNKSLTTVGVKLEEVKIRQPSQDSHITAEDIVSALRKRNPWDLFNSLRHALVQNEPLVLEFVHEAYQDQSAAEKRAWEKQLRFLVRLSAQKRLPNELSGEPWYWSANALTLLVSWHTSSFVGQHWAGIQVPGAVLSYACFAYSNFSGANLRAATLMYTVLYGVNFAGTDLRDVRWDDSPAFKLTQRAIALAHHPRQPWVALAQNKKILLMDTSSAQALATFAEEKTESKLTNNVSSIVFSPDGSKLASVNEGGTIRLWDVESRQLISELLAERRTTGIMVKEFAAVAFSPNGCTLLSFNRNGRIHSWDGESWIMICLFPKCGFTWLTPIGIAFESCGHTLVYKVMGSVIYLWNMATKQLYGLTGHTKNVTSVICSPNGGRMLISGGYDATIRLWNIQNGRVRVLRQFEDAVRKIAISPDSRTLASVGFDSQLIKLWDVETGESFGDCLINPVKDIFLDDLVFSPNNLQLIATYYYYDYKQAIIRSWDVQLRRFSVLKDHNEYDCRPHVVLGMERHRVLFSDSEGKKTLNYVISKESIDNSLMHKRDVALTFSPDRSQLVSGVNEEALRVWDAASSRCLRVPSYRNMPLLPLEVNWDGCQLDASSRRLLMKHGALFNDMKMEDVVTEPEPTVVSPTALSRSTQGTLSLFRPIPIARGTAITPISPLHDDGSRLSTAHSGQKRNFR